MRVVDWRPESFRINNHEMGWKPKESDYTSMKTKDSVEHTCAVTMARKYIVLSVAIVRITSESLSAPILWKMHQATTMNADRSRCFQ